MGAPGSSSGAKGCLWLLLGVSLGNNTKLPPLGGALLGPREAAEVEGL